MTDTKLCTYCDEPATTDEHVPPRLLFAKPRPNLVTVPACARCNGGFSLDDEYFRLVVALEETAGAHPGAAAVRDAVLRSLQNPNKLGYRRAFLNTLRDMERLSDAGPYLGRAASYAVDLERVKRVIARTTRGLFLHHLGRRLPLGCKVTAYVPRFIRPAPEVQTTLLELVNATHANPLQTIGEDAFRYRYSVAVDEENTSAWVFAIYEATTFLALTMGVDSPEVNDRGHR